MIPQGYPLVAEHESGEWYTVVGWDTRTSGRDWWPVVVSDHMPPRVVDPGELVHWRPPATPLPDPDAWSHDLEPVTDGPGMWWEVDVRTGGRWTYRVRFNGAQQAHEWAAETGEPTRVRFVRIQAEDEYDN